MFQKDFDDTTNFGIYAFVLDIVQGIVEKSVDMTTSPLSTKKWVE